MSTRTHQRPDSRASTTSATSQGHDLHPSNSQNQKPSQTAFVHGPEAALLQYGASMIHAPESEYHTAPPQQYAHQNTQQSAQFPMQATYGSHEAPYLQQDMAYSTSRLGSLPPHGVSDLMDDKRRKGSAVTATNDKELREMLARNQNRPLREVAQEVIQKERTPMAEKTKQLFAMLWLRAVCKPAKTSVPRNRVYSQYATRCGTERVVPLNPASFGKLVRVIFPGIQTRRLGVRGESKYHYVDLALEDEQSTSNLPAAWQGSAFQPVDTRQRSQSSSTQQIDFNNIPRLQADTAAFPPTDGSFDAQPLILASSPRGPASKGQTFVYPDTRGMQPGTIESLSYTHTLRFPPSNMPAFSENEPVNLPLIQQYLPPRTDSDTAEALSALYRTHCTSLIDSIRFCKEKQFFRLYTSFHGTLTVPVQKLFTHPNLAPWIEQCDLVMYRTMVRFVSRLTLQAAPVVVINILSNISGTLHNHIAKTFSAQPAHVLEAKLRPAAIFAGLLHRLIRVNQSAHAAANLLTIDQNREQMWHEWATMVNPKRVMETELPDCGYEEVYKIMTSEMRNLLEPLQAPNHFDDTTSIFNYDSDNGGFAQFLQNQTAPPSRNGPSQITAENVLDRWSVFLASLPSRFPQAPARSILHCISAIGTAALRDITFVGGQSYGHWWVLKLFVDEMALWMAEMGGFLEPTGSAAAVNGNALYHSPVMDNGAGRSRSGSRMSSMGPAGVNGTHGEEAAHSLSRTHSFSEPHRGNGIPVQINGLPYSTYQQGPDPKAKPQVESDIDDSGIGMSLLDDDLTLSKFGVSGSHVTIGGMGPTGMHVDPL